MAACFACSFQKREPYANLLLIVQSQALFSSSRFTQSAQEAKKKKTFKVPAYECAL